MQSNRSLIVDGIGLFPDSLPKPIVWKELFGNDHPVELEIGFGKGLFLVTAASANPDINFLVTSSDFLHPQIEQVLKDLGKEYEFHSYEGAGHAFFSTDRTSYRPEAANDGWQRVFTWFGRHLAG